MLTPKLLGQNIAFYELKPGFRTIFHYTEWGADSYYVPFPYIYFQVNFKQHGDKSVTLENYYPWFSNVPLTSEKDLLNMLPMGNTCFNGEYIPAFKNLEEAAKFAIDFFFRSSFVEQPLHFLYEDWEKMTIEEILNVRWTPYNDSCGQITIESYAGRCGEDQWVKP